ncbi:MAG: hypothetical protein FJ217_06880 [Ignavibacteria bacterium]|nr:hypothetical protein [Ignavibacteria bacterium]
MADKRVISHLVLCRSHSILLVIACWLGACSRTLDQNISDQIRACIVQPNRTTVPAVAGESILASSAVSEFYRAHRFAAVWSFEDSVKPAADDLILAVKRVTDDGLQPEDYHLSALTAGWREIRNLRQTADPLLASRLAEFDILLTDAILTLVSHLSKGKVDHETKLPRWDSLAAERDGAKIVERALRTGEIAKLLSALTPQDTVYEGLKTALRTYRALAAKRGWRAIPDTLGLRLGMSDDRVLALRKRLLVTGDLGPKQRSVGRLFDAAMVDGVRRFQRRHGLEPTGEVDSVTRATMNVPIKARIEQLQANLERWRWLSRKKHGRLIRVNVADMTLSVWDKGRDVMSMKVVVGVRDWPTPLFTSAIDQVILNPSWISPKTIFAAELLNYIRADSNYLARNKMKILGGTDKEEEIDPGNINWKELKVEEIDFVLWQAPGPLNIMGRVKFLLPNKYDVFLHDTPYKEDFPKRLRLASHGCIRLEKPFDLAAYLLQDVPGWTRERITSVVDSVERCIVDLPEPFPVDVIYLTVWIGRDGVMQFREDIYGLDARVHDALITMAPKPRSPISARR